MSGAGTRNGPRWQTSQVSSPASTNITNLKSVSLYKLLPLDDVADSLGRRFGALIEPVFALSCEIYFSFLFFFRIPLSTENCTQFVLHNVKVGLALVRNEFDWASVAEKWLRVTHLTSIRQRALTNCPVFPVTRHPRSFMYWSNSFLLENGKLCQSAATLTGIRLASHRSSSVPDFSTPISTFLSSAPFGHFVCSSTKEKSIVEC